MLFAKLPFTHRFSMHTMKPFYQVYSSESAEESKKPPIIFLHGMFFSGKIFKNAAPVICRKTKRKGYVPDARNHGRSPWIGEMSYDVLTKDLLDFMGQNAIQKAVVVGSSMGGRTAMNFALKYPDKIEALVIEDMTPKNVKSSSSSKFTRKGYTFIQDVLKGYPPHTNLDKCKFDAVDIFTEFMNPDFGDKERMMKNYFPEFSPVVKDGNTFRLDCNADVVVKMIENDTLIQNLPQQNVTFDGDALFLYGSKGFFNLGKDPSVKKLFPRAIVKRIEGASHFIHLDSPDEYASLISDFILHRNLLHSKY